MHTLIRNYWPYCTADRRRLARPYVPLQMRGGRREGPHSLLPLSPASSLSPSPLFAMGNYFSNDSGGGPEFPAAAFAGGGEGGRSDGSPLDPAAPGVYPTGMLLPLFQWRPSRPSELRGAPPRGERSGPRRSRHRNLPLGEQEPWGEGTIRTATVELRSVARVVRRRACMLAAGFESPSSGERGPRLMAHLLHPLGFVLFHCLGRFLETLIHGLLECATTPATNAKLLSAAERSGNAGAFALTTPVAYPRPPVLRRLRHGLLCSLANSHVADNTWLLLAIEFSCKLQLR